MLRAEALNLPTIRPISDDFDASVSRRTVKIKATRAHAAIHS